MPITRKVVPRKRAQLSNEDSEPESLHSDALDDLLPKKRTRSSNSNSNSNSSSPSKFKPKRRKRKDDVKDEDEVDCSDVDLKEGQQVVGRVVQAPKTGWGMLVFSCLMDDRPTSLKCLLVRFRRTRLIF
jgi:hypothetical protein